LGFTSSTVPKGRVGVRLSIQYAIESRLIHIRIIPYYTAEEIETLRDLRNEYKNAPIEHRRLFFQEVYGLWFDSLPLLPWEIGVEREKVWEQFLFR